MNNKRLFLRLFTIALVVTLAINSLIGNIKPVDARIIEPVNFSVVKPVKILSFLDFSGLEDLIRSTKDTTNNREGFVKKLAESAFNQLTDEKYNVMVFNMNQSYTERLNGVQLFKEEVYDDGFNGDIHYGVWIFEDGEFINRGDGGYINWAFQGWFERTGDQGHHVIFTRP